MFGVLKTPRRIILSGTPIQNDLGEFHAMVKYEASSNALFAVDG
jgi:DNA repair and recombination protein RAD54B